MFYQALLFSAGLLALAKAGSFETADALFPKTQVSSCQAITNASICCYSVQSRGNDLDSSPAGQDACVAARPGQVFSTGFACEASSRLVQNDFPLTLNDVNDGTTGGCWGRVYALYQGPGKFDPHNTLLSGGFPDAPDNDQGYQVLGTHDAATGEFGNEDHFAVTPGIISRRTQTVGFVDQLNCGVRHMDFRPYTDGNNINFHHAYLKVDFDFRKALRDMKAWCNAHPTELVVLWMNFCAEKNDDNRKFQCENMKVNGKEPNHCSGNFKEGSDWCYDPLKAAWEEGVPALGGSGFPPQWVPNYNAYAHPLFGTWTIADYKSFAAGNHGKLVRPDGSNTSRVSEAKGGLLILQGQSVAEGYTECDGKGCNWQPGQTSDALLSSASANGKGNPQGDPSSHMWRQSQAFYQQTETYENSFGLKYITTGPRKLGLVRLARSSGFNKDLLHALSTQRGFPRYKYPGQGNDNTTNAVSINDVCDWGTEIAEALGSAVISDVDKFKCRAACDAANAAMKQNGDDNQKQECPYMWSLGPTYPDKKAACEENTYRKCTYIEGSKIKMKGDSCTLSKIEEIKVTEPQTTEPQTTTTASKAMSTSTSNVNTTTTKQPGPVNVSKGTLCRMTQGMYMIIMYAMFMYHL